jgi:aminoglycoside phosphotransferase (APT) family kinase protein
MSKAVASEALPVAEVDAWLKSQRPDLLGTPEVTQYSGGASNWTYRLKYDNADLVLRRAPAGTKAKGAHDMPREYRLQKAIKPHFRYVPEMIALNENDALLGTAFYVMEHVSGVIPRKHMPRGLALNQRHVEKICKGALDALVNLHKVPLDDPALQSLGVGSGYVKRQIEGWSKRYRDARTWNVPKGEQIMAWLAAKLPQREYLCLTHNDYRFDNIVLSEADPTEIVAVLDWELATIGDALMDVGNMLAYWTEANDGWFAQKIRRQPTHMPGMLSREQVKAYYSAQSGIAVSDWRFYEVYGLFRLSAIAQQIYYRYHHRQTRNKAFRFFWLIVHHLHRRCLKLIKQSP